MLVHYYSLIPLLILVIPSYAHDLSAFDLIAHYTLQGTSQDDTGNYDTIGLVNAPYQGEDDMYCYGSYIFNGEDEDSSLVESPRIDAVNDNAFAVEVSFRLDTLIPGKTIFIVGSSWRYLGMVLGNDLRLRVLHNDQSHATTTPEMQTGVWYTATIVHDRADGGTSEYYLNDQVAHVETGELTQPENDTQISNTHAGNGNAFRGFWRNLKVYSRRTTSATSRIVPRDLTIFPNPFDDRIYTRGVDPAGTYSLFGPDGQLIRHGNTADGIIPASNLPDGMYILRLTGKAGAANYKVLHIAG